MPEIAGALPGHGLVVSISCADSVGSCLVNTNSVVAGCGHSAPCLIHVQCEVSSTNVPCAPLRKCGTCLQSVSLYEVQFEGIRSSVFNERNGAEISLHNLVWYLCPVAKYN